MNNFTIIRGDSHIFTLTKLDDTGTQVDYESTDSFIFSAKKNLKQETYDISNNNYSLSDGKCIIELLPTDTDIELGDYYYDVQYTTLEDTVYTIARGTLSIVWDVTRE